MEVDNKNLQMEIHIKANIKIIGLMGLARIHGKMGRRPMKVVLRMD